MSATDPVCPRCSAVLQAEQASDGVLWVCPVCSGRAVGLAVLREMFTAESINPLWLQAVDGAGQPGGACPSCRNTMIEVSLTDSSRTGVDVCRLCQFVWFDVREMQDLSPISAEDRARTLSERSREAQRRLANMGAVIKEHEARIAAERWRLIATALYRW